MPTTVVHADRRVLTRVRNRLRTLPHIAHRPEPTYSRRIRVPIATHAPVRRVACTFTPGYAYELTGSLLKEEFNRGGAMQHLLLRYTQALATQMALTAVCNRHHSLDQRCGSPRPRGSHLRMLRGRQERIGPFTAQPHCILTASVCTSAHGRSRPCGASSCQLPTNVLTYAESFHERS